MNQKIKQIKGQEKLTNAERNRIYLDLIQAFVLCKSVDEAATFIQDLITESELVFISRRLRIAKLLLDGKTYDVIRETLHVSETTISKIAFWLNNRGDGFRNIIRKLPKEKKVNNDPMDRSSWTLLKRQYPSYFLPEILIDEIVKTANKKQKERLKKIISGLDSSLKQKSQLHRELEKAFYKNYSTR